MVAQTALNGTQNCFVTYIEIYVAIFEETLTSCRSNTSQRCLRSASEKPQNEADDSD
jgi:hypothetical protein